jgi:hypothetical protein
MSLVPFDTEIINAIPSKDEVRLAHVNYCEGWHDKVGMGISVITAYVPAQGYRVFLKDNFHEFQEIAENPANVLIGYNSTVFDEPLLKAHSITPTKCYDFFRAVVKAHGLTGVGHGIGLSKLAEANHLQAKGEVTGKNAAILWQEGFVGKVIDYCLADTIRLKKLIELALAGRLRSPLNFRLVQVDLVELSGHSL